jgi:hypothetical protein
MTFILNGALALIAGIAVLFLPGIAWLSLFWEPDQGIFERLAEAIGLSISLTALMALFAYLIGWDVTSLGLIALYLALIPLAIWQLRSRWRERKFFYGKDSLETGDVPSNNDAIHPIFGGVLRQDYLRYSVLALIFFFLLIWRFYQIRNLVLPVWVDSIHHVQIVNLFLANGGIPETFEPYMPVPFFYHYAFHALAAVFSFFGRLSSENAVLILGQVLNAGVALAVYRLGIALWADWRRAAAGAILVGFVTHMPAYYLTWGRYTLLTGILLLPLAMAAALDIVNKGASKSRLSRLILFTAGILLAHYYAAVLLAIFLIILGALNLIQDGRQNAGFRWNTWLPLFVASLAGLLLAGPWLYRMWGYAQGGVEIGAIQLSIDAVDEFYFPDYLSYLWRLLGPNRNHALIFIALPGLLITLFRKRTQAFGLWAIALSLFSLPWGIYVAPFRPDHAAIVLFLPTGLLVSELFVSLVDWSPIPRLVQLKTAAVFVLFAALVGWGFWGTRSVINSATVLATKADLEAVNWIEANVPAGARFFINVNHWQYGIYRGVDGGWWISPLTGRETLLPSGLYPMGEEDYVHGVNAVAARASQIKGCTPDFWELIQEEELSYIYINDLRGSVRSNHFTNCPNAELIYENDNIYIFRILEFNLETSL